MRAWTCAGVAGVGSVIIVMTLRLPAAVSCVRQGPLGAVSHVATLLPQKQVVTSPPTLQTPTGAPPVRMQAEAVWQSAKPVGSLVWMPQQPSVAGFMFALRQAVQDATRAAG